MRYVPTREQMDNPLVQAWVFDHIKKARAVGDAPREAALAALVDREVILDVLGEGQLSRLGTMLKVTPKERLMLARGELLASWPDWPGMLPAAHAELMTALDPDGLHGVLAGELERLQATCDEPDAEEGLAPWGHFQIRAVLAGVAALGSRAHDLVSPAMEVAVRAIPDDPRLLAMAVWASLRAGDQHVAVGLLSDHWIEEPDEDDEASWFDALEEALRVAHEELAPGSPYFRYFREADEDETELALEDLPELFVEQAPLEELNPFSDLDDDDLDFDEEVSLFEVVRPRLALLPEGDAAPQVAAFARELAGELDGELEGLPARNLLAAFVLGAVAASYSRPRLNPAAWNPRSLARVAAADLSPHPCLAEVAAEVERLPPAQQVHLLTLAGQLAVRHGERNVVRLMGLAARPELLQLLIHYMDMDAEDALCEEATRAICRLGPAAEEGILACWEALDSSQQIYGREVLENLGGEDTVQFLLRTLPAIKADPQELEGWCRVAEALVDPRLLDALAPELKRGLPAVEETYITLCRLLGHEGPELDRLQEQRLEARTEARQFVSALLQGEAPPSLEACRMQLVCPDCGEANLYDVTQVYVSPADPGAGAYVADDLACLSCGSREPLEVSGSTDKLALTSMLLQYAASRSGESYDGPLRMGQSKMIDGRLMAPAAAVNEYRQKLAADPRSVSDLLGLGNLYVHLGPRRRAEECFRRALELDPASPEAAKSLAEFRLEDGDEEGAFAFLHQAQAARARWRFHRLQPPATPGDFERDFVDRYNHLAGKLGHEPLPEVPPGPLSRSLDRGHGHTEPVRRGPKVGRNAPCPCGSGKKYKKCCLRRGRG